MLQTLGTMSEFPLDVPTVCGVSRTAEPLTEVLQS
jgi:hypothetical protein